jgi:hypothetical protein
MKKITYAWIAFALAALALAGSAWATDLSIVKKSDCSTVIAEGSFCYNTLTHILYMGDGAAAISFTSAVNTGVDDDSAYLPSSGFPSSVTSNTITVFNGTTGKSVKASSLTGLLKATAGVLSSATPWTDYALSLSEVAGSATVALAASSVTNTQVYNTGQADSTTVTLTLPVAAMGEYFTASVGSACPSGTWKICAATSEVIYLDGAVGSGGGCAIVTPAIGNYLTCFTFKGDSGHLWACKSGAGTWTAGP